MGEAEHEPASPALSLTQNCVKGEARTLQLSAISELEDITSSPRKEGLSYCSKFE